MSAVEHLKALVGFDTQNPGGDEAALVAYLRNELEALGPTLLQSETLATGHAYVYAAFGHEPTLLFNAHIDTVPAAPGWSADPFRLRFDGGDAIGLGTADTKGAVAALLEAANRATQRRFALLFSGDEEKSGSVMRHFIAQGKAKPLRTAVVCEPTSLAVGIRHRGLLSASITAKGPGGHSSCADTVEKPVLRLARLAIALHEWASSTPLADGKGMCLNLAEIRTGSPFNVIPALATLDLSVRPPGGTRLEESAQAIRRLVPETLHFQLQATNPPFETKDVAWFCKRLGVPTKVATDLDFWTEAALLADAGVDAVVFGPGEIKQAHAADEHVSLAQLDAATDHFLEAMRGSD